MAERQTIQVPGETHVRLRALATERHETMGDTLAWLLEREEEARFWEQFDAACEAIQVDPVALAEDRAEVALWDSTLLDGLDDE